MDRLLVMLLLTTFDTVISVNITKKWAFFMICCNQIYLSVIVIFNSSIDFNIFLLKLKFFVSICFGHPSCCAGVCISAQSIWLRSDFFLSLSVFKVDIDKLNKKNRKNKRIVDLLMPLNAIWFATELNIFDVDIDQFRLSSVSYVCYFCFVLLRRELACFIPVALHNLTIVDFYFISLYIFAWNLTQCKKIIIGDYIHNKQSVILFCVWVSVCECQFWLL